MSNNFYHGMDNVILRPAAVADHEALRALAGRDSDVVPAGPLLLAEVGGTLRAAWSLAERRAIADPFHPTADLVELLRTHAEQAERRRRPLPQRPLARLIRLTSGPTISGLAGADRLNRGETSGARGRRPIDRPPCEARGSA
jgi:hypothetical protein